MLKVKGDWIHLIAAIFFLGIGFLILKPYLMAFIGGAIVAYLLYPTHSRLKKYISNVGSATAITAGVFGLFMLLLTYGIRLIVNEFGNVYGVVSSLNELTTNQILLSIINTGMAKATNILSQQINAIPHLVLSVIIFFISLFFLMLEGEKLLAWAKHFLPMSSVNREVVVSRISQNIDAFVHVQIVIGIIQGIAAAIGFWMFGVPYPLLAGLAAAVLSIMPIIGVYVLYIAISIYLFYIGDVNTGVLLLTYGIIIGSLLDYVVRPFFFGKKAKIHPLIIFLGIFGGLELFGLIGIILGPILLLITAIVLKEIKLSIK